MKWERLLDLIGKDQDDQAFIDLAIELGEKPKLSRSPLVQGDPECRTLYHKYLKSGLELGFRSQKLNQIHLFVQRHEGYTPFRGDILDQPACEWTRDDLVETLGPPDSQGGDKMDGLLGYIRPWVRYKKFGSALHAEFSQDGRLWKFTLMLS